MLESLFKKVADLKTPTQAFSYEYCKIFKKNFKLFYGEPLVTASDADKYVITHVYVSGRTSGSRLGKGVS